MHPAVRPAILGAMEAADRDGAPAVVVEAIKLVESGLADLCDQVWLVDCPPSVQRARLEARGMSAADAERRISAQAGLRGRAGTYPGVVVIDASGDPGATRDLVGAAYERVLERAGR